MEFVTDTEHPITIPCGETQLEGLFHVPEHALGAVVFAHGSGSSRFSPRNQYIARELQKIKFATLLFDLLTPEEDEIDETTSEFRFDIPFLAERLVATTQWLVANPFFNKLPLGYFGASTGGGAALAAAAKERKYIKAVVSRGGRPDLAKEALTQVEAPTLLIVGGEDREVIKLNELAYEKLHCEKKIAIVPGATHLFEEKGKLEEVSRLANEWFQKYLQ